MATSQSEIEANNSTAAANAVNVGDSITGQIASSSDQDFFKLVAQGSGTLSLGFDVPTNNSYSDYFKLELLNATGTSLGSYATGVDKTYSFGIPAAGTYYVKVTPTNYLDTNQYSISTALALGSAAGYEAEANNSTAAANAVNVGDSITGQIASSSDQDFFKLVAQGSGTLSLGFDVPTNNSYSDYFKLELLNATGTSLGSYATGVDKTYSFGIPAAGTYYVKVTPTNYLDTNQYSISTALALGSAAGYEAEANNSTAAANAVNVGDSITGQIASSSDQDFFKLVAQGSGTLSLGFDVPTNNSYSDYFKLELLNATGTSLGSYATGVDKTYSFGIPAAGTYYVKVTPTNYLDTNQYSISTALALGSAAGYEAEANNSTAAANAVNVGDSITGQIASSSDQDFFKLVAQGSGTLSLGFDVPTNNSYSDYFKLELLNATGTSLGSYATGVDKTYSFGIPAAGTYYVKVTPTNYLDTNQYSISTALALGSAAGYEAEANNSTAAANAVNVGDSITGQIASSSDQDFFKLVAQGSGTLSLGFDVPTNNSYSDYFKLELLNATGTSLGSYATGVDKTYSFGIPAAGTYYVKVTPTNYLDTNQYSIIVSGTFNSVPDSPTYAVSVNQSSVNEGSTATFTVSTTNVASGTSLAYTLSGVSASDISGGSLSGTTTVGSNGQATISVPIAADQTTEGNETLTVTVQGKTASTTIVDTSIMSSISYTITAEQSAVVEGSTVTFVILKTGSLASSTVYFSTLAGTASTRDGDYLGFSDQVLYFGFGVNSISVPVSTVADNLIEADETFYGVVYAIPGEQGDFLAGRFLAQSNAITIKDQAAIYTVSVNSSQVSEGSTAIFTVSTTNVTSGTSLAYTLLGVSASDITGGSLSGTTTVGSNGQATILVPIAADQTTEGNETLTVTVQGKTASVQILDSSTAPNATYAVQATTVSVAEGSTAQFLLTTTNLAAGTSVAYTLSGVSAADIVGGITSGSVTVAANGQATISVPLAADLTTEGVETLTVTVQGKTASMQVLDTSTAPAPTYSIAAKSSSVDEGGVAEFNVTTTNVAAGTALSYGIKGISSADIVGGALTGTATVDSAGKATISIPIALDLSTEGTETLEVTLEGKSASVSIKDTSLTPQAGYALTAQSPSVNEGDVAVFVLSGTNVAAGTTVSYTLSGVTTLDITGGKLTGSAVLGADGRASISIPIAEDQSTEGQETLTLAAQGQTASIKINDTSLSKATYELAPRAASVNEGVSAIFDLTTTNVPSGTVLSYTITGVSDTDIVGKSLSGSVSIGANGKGVITVPIANDGLTEGAEYLSVLVQGASAAVMVNDTSKTSLEIPATFTINAASGGFDVRAAVGSEVNTASSLVVKVGNTWTTGFRANAEALLKWHQNPASVGRNTALDGLSTDQALAALDRGLTGSEQSAFITLLGLIADVEIKSGMPTFDGNLVLPAVATPSYQLQALSASVNEGTNAQFQVTTTNVAAGTELGYTLSGQGITSADIIGGQLSGKVIIGSNGQGTITVSLAPDQSTEGPETLIVTLEGKQSTVSIQDTSTPPKPSDTTPPSLLSVTPSSGTKDVAVNQNMVFTFNENIAKGSGVIQLFGPGGALVESFNVQTSNRLTWIANQLTIDPTADLLNDQTYRIVIPNGAIDDLTGNDFAGTSIELTTVGQAGPPPGF